MSDENKEILKTIEEIRCDVKSIQPTLENELRILKERIDKIA